MKKNVASEMDDFVQLLATIAKLKEAAQWDQVIEIVGKKLGALLDVKTPKELRKLTETGLLANLVNNGPMATLWVPYKQIMLIRLLKEAGDYTAVKFPPNGGKGWYLTSLHLLLDALTFGEIPDYAHLVPTIAELLTVLGKTPLLEGTQLRLAREYQRKGVSAQAKEEIKTALETVFKQESKITSK